MSFGQSILSILALVVITFLVVSANRIVTQSLQDELTGEAYNQAGEIASDLINEALKKKFDDPTVILSFHVSHSPYTIYYHLYDFYQDTTDFTKTVSFGPSPTEKTAVPLPDRYPPYKSITGYDDFDDYDKYQRIVDTPIMTGFVVNCTVSYINNVDMNTPIIGRTYYKRLLITVSQPTYLPNALTFSTFMTY
jgi:hypothetical protein